MKLLLKISLLALIGTLASCGGGGGTVVDGGTSGSDTTHAFKSPIIFTSEFVNALNAVDGTHFTTEEKNIYHTLRSKRVGEDDWFVIYDDKFNEYKAVSLQYIRAITYYDYYANNKALAAEFRAIEHKDIQSGRSDGDYLGDDYEVVDKRADGFYEGRESGFLYEDEAKTTDVSLLAIEQEQKKFFAKAARVSFTYNLSLETSLSMITLGAKMEKMLARANSELTQEDQAVLASDLSLLTGVTLSELENASQDSAVKEEVLAKVANKIGSSTQNLESRILPEVFGIRF